MLSCPTGDRWRAHADPPRCRSRHPETGGVRSLPSSAETVGAGRSHVRPDRNRKTAKHISKSRCLRANDIRVHIRPLLESQRRASIAVGRETSNPGRAWMASWTGNTGLREFGVAGGSGGLRLLAHDLDGRELVTDPWPLVVEAAASVTVHVRTHEGAPAAGRTGPPGARPPDGLRARLPARGRRCISSSSKRENASRRSRARLPASSRRSGMNSGCCDHGQVMLQVHA